MAFCGRVHIGTIAAMEGSAGSWASSDVTRRIMRANRSRDTGPELAIRRRVYARGLRYRVDHPPHPSLRRRADLVFTAARVAVFVDGCYWHGCPIHYRVPKTNSSFWAEKASRNRTRDEDTDVRLTALGWLVVRIWEHEDPDVAAERVVLAVNTARASRTS